MTLRAPDGEAAGPESAELRALETGLVAGAVAGGAIAGAAANQPYYQ